MRIEQAELELATACLLANTYDAVSASGGTVRVRCANGDDDTVRVEISHDGAPLSTKARSRVFDPFFSTKPGHLGLGLNIVRRIVGRWGGTFDLAPGEPKGVISALVLPLSPTRSSET
jgi:signal transduction histidine kinase